MRRGWCFEGLSSPVVSHYPGQAVLTLCQPALFERPLTVLHISYCVQCITSPRAVFTGALAR